MKRLKPLGSRPTQRAKSVASITYKGFNEVFNAKVILVEVPNDKDFTQALKLNVPARKRMYSPFDKAWILMRDQFDKVAHLCEEYFSQTILIDFPSPEVASTSWATLYLREGAPLEVVRAVYKALALKYHPDKVGGDTEVMKTINLAYKDIMGEFRNGD